MLILCQLLLELLNAGKFYFTADALHKLHCELLTVKVTGKIKDIRFQTRLGNIAKGRIVTNIGHASDSFCR